MMTERLLRRLESLNHAFAARAVGHTTSVLVGAKATNAVVIVQNAQQMEMCKADGIDSVLIDNLEALRGRRKPVVIDHYPLQSLVSEAAQHIKQQEAQVTTLRAALEKYGWHHRECEMYGIYQGVPACTCGFKQTLDTPREETS